MGKKNKSPQHRLYIVKAVDLESGNTYVDPESKNAPYTDLKAAHLRANQFASECRHLTGRGYFATVDWINEESQQ